MLRRPCLVLLIFELTLICFTVKDSCAGENKFNVQWKEELIPFYIQQKPSNAADFFKMETAKWEDDDERDGKFHLVLEYMDNDQLREKEVSSCADLLGIYPKIYNIKTDGVFFSNLNGWMVACEGMKKVSMMTSSKASYLGFNAKAMLRNLREVRLQSADEEVKDYFIDLKSTKRIDCRKKNSCTAITDERFITITVLAIGDYNSDGIEDALVVANSKIRNGGDGRILGMVMTKLCKKCMVSVLNWW